MQAEARAHVNDCGGKSKKDFKCQFYITNAAGSTPCIYVGLPGAGL